MIPALGAALVATALEAVGRFTLNGPYLPELIAQWLFAQIPVWAFTPLFRTFGYNSKYYAFGGMIAAEVVGLLLVGIGIRKWMRRREETGDARPWVGASIVALLAVVTLGGVLPLLGAGVAGRMLGGGARITVATVILVAAAYVAALRWKLHR